MIHKVLFYVYVNNIEKSKARLERKIKAVMACPQVGTTPAQPTPCIILMPNPSNDAVVVADSWSETPRHDVKEVQVISPLGHTVLYTKGSARFNVSSLPAATYFVKVVTRHGTYLQKLVVE
jgi:hypothetical protein